MKAERFAIIVNMRDGRRGFMNGSRKAGRPPVIFQKRGRRLFDDRDQAEGIVQAIHANALETAPCWRGASFLEVVRAR